MATSQLPDNTWLRDPGSTLVYILNGGENIYTVQVDYSRHRGGCREGAVDIAARIQEALTPSASLASSVGEPAAGLTDAERKCIDDIEEALYDESDNCGAKWADAGEVDVPKLITAARRMDRALSAGAALPKDGDFLVNDAERQYMREVHETLPVSMSDFLYEYRRRVGAALPVVAEPGQLAEAIKNLKRGILLAAVNAAVGLECISRTNDHGLIYKYAENAYKDLDDLSEEVIALAALPGSGSQADSDEWEPIGNPVDGWGNWPKEEKEVELAHFSKKRRAFGFIDYSDSDDGPSWMFNEGANCEEMNHFTHWRYARPLPASAPLEGSSQQKGGVNVG